MRRLWMSASWPKSTRSPVSAAAAARRAPAAPCMREQRLAAPHWRCPPPTQQPCLPLAPPPPAGLLHMHVLERAVYLLGTARAAGAVDPLLSILIK